MNRQQAIIRAHEATRMLPPEQAIAAVQELLEPFLMGVYDSSVLYYADLKLDMNMYEAWRGDRKLDLRPMGVDILACFMQNPFRVLSPATLYEEIWGADLSGTSSTLRVHIGRLRQAMGAPRLIHTVPLRGYVLQALETTAQAA